MRNHSAPRQSITAINEKTRIENHQQEQQKNKTRGQNLKRSNSVFHRSLLKKIKKTITVGALEIECLSHNINVSSLKNLMEKFKERPEGEIKKNQSEITREALMCIQKFQS